MICKGRRTGVAAIAVLTACLGAAGCVNTESASQPSLSPGQGVAPYQVPGSPPPVGPRSPAGPTAKAAPPGGTLTARAAAGDSEIQQTAFFRKPRGGAPGMLPPDFIEPPAGAVVQDGPVVDGPDGANLPLPGELRMASHPPHRVAPPDILKIDAIRLIPRGPYRLDPLEVVQITVTDTLPNQPIAGNFIVTPEGTINLGYSYGTVRLGGLTIDQAQEAVRKHLGSVLRNPTVSIAVAQFRGIQAITGDHLVRQDGTVSLGLYGSVYVAGMTLGQVKCVIEKHLENFLVNPQVAVDVFAYNSSKYYVIVDGGGFGQQVIPLPITGNERVLDAIANVQGIAPVSSKHRIWVARPSPCDAGCNIVLPVDWNAITQGASTCTNYELFPGDRVYVAANRLIAFDNYLSQVFAPIERIFGITLLGTNTVRSFTQNNGTNNGGGFFVVGR